MDEFKPDMRSASSINLAWELEYRFAMQSKAMEAELEREKANFIAILERDKAQYEKSIAGVDKIRKRFLKLEKDFQITNQKTELEREKQLQEAKVKFQNKEKECEKKVRDEKMLRLQLDHQLKFVQKQLEVAYERVNKTQADFDQYRQEQMESPAAVLRKQAREAEEKAFEMERKWLMSKDEIKKLRAEHSKTLTTMARMARELEEEKLSNITKQRVLLEEETQKLWEKKQIHGVIGESRHGSTPSGGKSESESSGRLSISAEIKKLRGDIDLQLEEEGFHQPSPQPKHPIPHPHPVGQHHGPLRGESGQKSVSFNTTSIGQSQTYMPSVFVSTEPQAVEEIRKARADLMATGCYTEDDEIILNFDRRIEAELAKR
ncbi:Centrosomal protein of 120kDa-like protein [Aduncisulcus paluster]|uniref:Centrosomal protein of 120kDa-like protein n=1 Tax=Aduncisulcus paluster TaxID=2918883 RepID=A0ABQ5JX02_9EUKA|nr:Centrosomal protein of 120kDa-like protein [Aduncisulcus paluster]